MFEIFQHHDKDNDGYLKKGEVTDALAQAGIVVIDEELAFEWLDRDYEGRLSYKKFRRATEKASTLCPACQYNRVDESDDSADDQVELLRMYWRKFDPERNNWVYADNVIDYLANDWGIQVDPAQR